MSDSQNLVNPTYRSVDRLCRSAIQFESDRNDQYQLKKWIMDRHDDVLRDNFLTSAPSNFDSNRHSSPPYSYRHLLYPESVCAHFEDRQIDWVLTRERFEIVRPTKYPRNYRLWSHPESNVWSFSMDVLPDHFPFKLWPPRLLWSNTSSISGNSVFETWPPFQHVTVPCRVFILERRVDESLLWNRIKNGGFEVSRIPQNDQQSHVRKWERYVGRKWVSMPNWPIRTILIKLRLILRIIPIEYWQEFLV